MIYSNGTSNILDTPSLTYVPSYIDSVYDEEEELLDTFSANYDYHSSTYNDLFNSIIYSDLCQYVQYESTPDCEAFNQGILTKGLYSSVIEYWDYLRQLNYDFLQTNRSRSMQVAYLNDPRLQIAYRMQDYYFK